MAKRWLRVRVDLTEGGGRPIEPSPGRVMIVPPTTTFDQFAVAVDIAFGRWDTTPERCFTAPSTGRHAPDEPAANLPGSAVVAEVMRSGAQFLYQFDAQRRWLHHCHVMGTLEPAETKGLSEIPVPLLGWGSVPDQHGRQAFADPADEPRLPVPDLTAIRVAERSGDAAALLEALQGHDLRPALQQVGQALMRAYRAAAGTSRTRLSDQLGAVRHGLVDRAWEGDDLLAAEIEALLSGTERRGRTLVVDFDQLTDVMANGGDDPGGYLHLDTGEVVPAYLRHDSEYREAVGDTWSDDEDDDLWLYIDNDVRAQWQDMAEFAAAAGDRSGILSVAIRGRGAFRRFRETVDDLDLTQQWRSFSDERSWGRARAVLNHYGIRAL